MRRITILALVIAALPIAAWVKESIAMPDAAFELPTVCTKAAGSMGAPKPPAAMDGMSGMDEVQAANMNAMMKMHGAMMAATMIKDPDLAFNCGMIVHHQGGIAMSEVELKLGKDEQSKETARMIIDAQTKEIKEMTARVEALAQNAN
ncbi:hypothetical protein Sa4125_17690 [Aureimonas sp. SA4125]|uniref:DUF305 domain-containing protein n=1 Tax=Aureimonas sp. SA4125 TaxID=2826993 RepID=UPI001CC4F954|nr:DUF305 domain-containing protein [Aureimonas sp. SA4125]BDA84227.1 hypothetical protein Sa4125_17690 [Aureimonas sp. SA4125]